MRRAARSHPTQLSLRLAPEQEPPLITAETPTLLQALADLLLAALGPSASHLTTEAATLESVHEPKDHA